MVSPLILVLELRELGYPRSNFGAKFGRQTRQVAKFGMIFRRQAPFSASIIYRPFSVFNFTLTVKHFHCTRTIDAGKATIDL